MKGFYVQALLTMNLCMKYEGSQSTNEHARAMTSFRPDISVTVTFTFDQALLTLNLCMKYEGSLSTN